MSTPTSTTATQPQAKLTKKDLTADHPTWCPGCGDFAVLAAFYKVLEKLQIPHEKIGIGKGCEYVPKRSGYLHCFANDAWGFYGNNKGSVTLTVACLG